MEVSKNVVTLKSFILIGFPLMKHPYWGTPIYGNNRRSVYQKGSKLHQEMRIEAETRVTRIGTAKGTSTHYIHLIHLYPSKSFIDKCTYIKVSS